MSKIFGLDLRSLALMRIGLGLILLYDLATRAFSVEALLSDSGAMPRELARAQLPLEWIPSVHFLSGEWSFQALLLGLHAAFAVALLVGWQTRLVTVVCWYLTLSLHFRNEVVLNGGDYLLRAWLFWGMFLPLGDFFSLDSRRGKERPKPAIIGSVATAGLTMQLCLLYWGAAMTKMAPIWTQEYTALYYGLHLEAFTTGPGVWLRQFPGPLKVGTFVAYWTEWLAPVLLLVRSSRWIGLALLTGLHLTIAVFMQVGLFWCIPLAGLVAFIPSSLWERMGKDGLDTKRVERRLHPALSLPLVALIACLPYLNLSLVRPHELKVPGWLYYSARTLGIHYGWNMFARTDHNLDGWYVFEAVLESGERVDLRTGGEPSPAKPWVTEIYQNQRWRRWMCDMYQQKNKPLAESYARYLARKWATERGEPVKRVRVHYVTERTPFPYEPVEPQDRVFLEVDITSASK